MHTDQAFWTAGELAQHLRVDVTTVRRWISSGDLPALRVGKSLRIPAAAVEDFVARSRVESA
jgi:excisionase family DNA binding protein